MRINSKKRKGEKTMKEKTKKDEATPGFEPSCPPTTSSEKVRLPTTRPCDYCAELIVLKYFYLPFTVFEPCGAVFIMNSKIHLR